MEFGMVSLSLTIPACVSVYLYICMKIVGSVSALMDAVVCIVIIPHVIVNSIF